MSNTYRKTNGGDVATCALIEIRFESTLILPLTWLATADSPVDMADCWPMEGRHVNISEVFLDVVVGTIDFTG
ncbi:hypothetical protein FNV43_RR21924 [Rhamnella rubrinervis]|uniref:Uncharacterized protein n=1 Tax=Rhamnella rubrinervis TaxID=2594499 RepID=A0A8K0DPA0_9ROSA|nr:hypothetical protein FNV43_RR21924 [Rhamnella rubrinervis]